MEEIRLDNAVAIPTAGEKTDLRSDNESVPIVNSSVNNYPNKFVRSCIVVGVALSLFLVRS